MQQVAQAILLIWIGMMLTVAVLLMLRNYQMKNKPHFDPDVADHVMAIALMLDGILNTGRTDVRFALVIWRDQHDDVQGLVSNDTNDKTVVGMLDDAKKQINNADGIIHHTCGHA
jgi:hypothetical protein